MNYIPMYYHRDVNFARSDRKLDVTKAKEVKDESSLEREEVLEAMKKTEVPVKKIICFGLGTMRSATLRKSNETLLHQHYTALDLADHLRVPIIFQDPAYDDDDKSFLHSLAKESNINIEFVDSPNGLLNIDESTFVFATGRPAFPLKQLTADLTHEFGGPAAIFFEDISKWTSAGPKQKKWSIEDEISHFYKGDNALLDPLNRHVVSMMKNFKQVLSVQDWYEKNHKMDGEGNRTPRKTYNYESALYLKRKDTVA